MYSDGYVSGIKLAPSKRRARNAGYGNPGSYGNRAKRKRRAAPVLMALHYRRREGKIQEIIVDPPDNERFRG
jgi:hypothetical protein